MLLADQVTFNNGDRLTGYILKCDAKNLRIGTAVAGEVTAPWGEIYELRSDVPLHVALVDGKTLVGKITMHRESLEIQTITGPKLEASKQSVLAVRNDAEQAAYEKSQHPSLSRGWDGAMDGGFELTRGNSETRNFRLAFQARRKTPRNELLLYTESLYSIDDLPTAQPHVTANENRGVARFNHDLTRRFFVFANTEFMTDALQDLNLRSVLGGGGGYHLLKGEKATLDVLGGANFTRENYVNIQRNLMAGQFGDEFNYKFGKNTTLIQRFAFFPDLTDAGRNYRANLSVGTVTKIVKWFGWQNSLTDTYVTNPPLGKKRNEFMWTSGLHIAFSH
jgi:putative salt-induced outer membrane protein YdiY